MPSAALFDLGIGRADVRPDAAAGYAACQAATHRVEEGCVGAGTGATVAKLNGPAGAVKSGIGTAVRTLKNGTLIGALVAVNAVGAIYEPHTGAAIATPRKATTTSDTNAAKSALLGTSTTIGVIATTAPLDAGGISRLATLGHDGLALAIRPAHTSYDGDTLFALSLPGLDPTSPDVLELEQAAVEVVAEAVVRAVRAASPLHGIPAASV